MTDEVAKNILFSKSWLFHPGFLFFGGLEAFINLCMHLEKISLLLLRVAPSWANGIKNFSLVQSAQSQIPRTGLNGFAWSMISHFSANFTLSSFKVCVCVCLTLCHTKANVSIKVGKIF